MAVSKNQRFVNIAKSKLASPIAANAELMTLTDGSAFTAALTTGSQWMTAFIKNGANFEPIEMWQDTPPHTFGIWKGDNISPLAFPAGAEVYAAQPAEFFQSVNNSIVNMGTASYRRVQVISNLSLSNNTTAVPGGDYASVNINYATSDIGIGDVLGYSLAFYNFTNPFNTHFRIKAKAKFNPTAGGVRKAWLIQQLYDSQNNATNTEIDYKVISGSTGNEQTIFLESPVMRIRDTGVFNVNDRVELRLFQDSGAALNLLPGSYIEIEWLNRGVV
jgi:hypothetical protein